MVTRDGNESLQRPLLKRLTSPSSGVLPSRQQYHIGPILAHLLRRCTRLLMVLPSRQQSAMCHIMSCGVLPSRQQYHIGDYPGTPPPSVYQVTHSTAFQAAERHVRHLSCGWYPTTGMSSTCKAKRFISVYRLGEDGDLLKEGDAGFRYGR